VRQVKVDFWMETSEGLEQEWLIPNSWEKGKGEEEETKTIVMSSEFFSIYI